MRTVNWDNIKCTNFHIIRVLEGEEREEGPEKILEEKIAENFPNMGKEIVTQVHEAQGVPARINLRRNRPRHIVTKLTKIKDKEKILKATREKKQITCKGIPIRLSTDFSADTLQVRREWLDIFKVMKGKNLQPRKLYQEKHLFSWRNQKFTDRQKLREFSITRPALQQILKEFL